MKYLLLITLVMSFANISLAKPPQCKDQAFKAMTAYHLIVPRTKSVMERALVRKFKEDKTTFFYYDDQTETINVEGTLYPVEVYRYTDNDLQTIEVQAVQFDCEITSVSYENGAK